MNDFELMSVLQERLSIGYIPSELPCRLENFKKLKREITLAAKSRRNKTIFVSGVPGTGKTATVRKVLESLDLDCHFFNAMQCPMPTKIYTVIYRQISGRKLSPSAALVEINNWVKQLKKPTVIVIDEVDMLLTKDERVLYSISDWATMGSPLILVLLANTVDLFQNAMPRINSRAGATTYDFQPYNYEELRTIVAARIEEILPVSELISEPAFRIALTPIAQTMGDARKALHIISVCLEKALQDSINNEKKFFLTPQIVSQKRRELNVNMTSNFIKALPEVAARLLYHICKRSMSSATGEILWDHLASDVAFSMSSCDKVLTSESLLRGINDLRECGFVNCPQNPYPFDVVSISDYIDPTDTLLALKETKFGEKYFL